MTAFTPLALPGCKRELWESTPGSEGLDARGLAAISPSGFLLLTTSLGGCNHGTDGRASSFMASGVGSQAVASPAAHPGELAGLPGWGQSLAGAAAPAQGAGGRTAAPTQPCSWSERCAGVLPP